MVFSTKKLKKVIPSTLTAFTAGLLSFQAGAYTPDSDDGIYISADGGLSLLQKIEGAKNHPGFNFGGALGYKIDNYRFEGEFRYLRNGVKVDDDAVKVHWNTYAYMANAYYDIDQFSEYHVRPFVGAGIGYARVTLGGVPAATNVPSFNTFAYQVMPGVAYDFNDNVSANIAYRYLGTSKLKNSSDTYQSHSVNLGLSYKFGSFN